MWKAVVFTLYVMEFLIAAFAVLLLGWCLCQFGALVTQAVEALL